MRKSGLLFLLVLVLAALRPAAAETRRLTLREAVLLAIDHAPDTQIADAAARQAEEALRETRSLNLPRAAIGSGAAYNNGFPLSIEGSAPSIFRFEASQPVFSMQNRNLIREADAAARAARSGSEVARNELAARTALVYARLDQARKTATLVEKQCAAQRRQRELTEVSLAAGRARPLDVLTSQAAVVRCEQQLLTAREQAQLSQAELRELTGIAATVAIATVTPALTSPLYDLDAEALFAQSAAASPEIKQAEAKVRAKEFHVAAEKAERYPRLVAIGEYAMFSRANNYEDYYSRFERNNYLLGISAQVPLFDGFQSRARVAKSRQELSAEQLQLQRLKSDLRLNIQKSLSELRVARGALTLADSELALARETFTVNAALLEKGRVSEREMTEIRLQIEQKELAKIEAEHALLQHQLELLRVTGSLLTVF